MPIWPVAVLTHEFGEGGAVLGDGESAGHPVLAEALAVLAHHQGAPARAAGRVGNVRRREAYPFLGQAVDVRSGYVLAVIAPEVSVTQVIDIDQDDVGLVGGRHGSRAKEASSGKSEEGE